VLSIEILFAKGTELSKSHFFRGRKAINEYKFYTMPFK